MLRRLGHLPPAPSARTGGHWVLFGQLYFPGWKAKEDGSSGRIIPERPSLLRIPIPAGRSDVLIWFGETLVRRAADVISLGVALLILGYFLVSLSRTNRLRVWVL